MIRSKTPLLINNIIKVILQIKKCNLGIYIELAIINQIYLIILIDIGNKMVIGSHKNLVKKLLVGTEEIRLNLV